MKKDSNMFNDNSIETEGVPADKTAEIPKVVDSTEEENAKKPLVLFGREFSRKQVCAAGAGILCAAFLIGGGAYAISHASWTGDSNAPAVSQSKDEEKQDKSDAKTPETSDNKKNDSGSKNDSGNNGSGNKSDSKPSGGSGNSGSGSSSGGSSKKDDTTAHQHNWVAQTKTVHHDAQYKTVHHDAQYKTVHHDAVTKTVNICNQCGQDITGNEAAHFKAAALSGGNCQSCHSETRTVQAAYDEQVKVSDAYDEQVQVSAVWEETVTTGYKCSSCGATK